MSGVNELFHKIAAVVKQVEGVEKKGHNDHFHYDYATAEDVLRAIRGPLADKHVALFCSVQAIDERAYKTSGGKESVITTVHVDFTFADGDTGEMFKCSWAGQGDDPADKGLGKAYTNAVKTFLRQTFLLPQGDDPEADTSTDKRAAERAGSSSRRQSSGAPKPSDKQKDLLKRLISQKGVNVAQLLAILSDLGVDGDIDEGWVDRLTGGREGQMSQLIDRLMTGDIPAVESMRTPETDVPGEAPVHPKQDGEEFPRAA